MSLSRVGAIVFDPAGCFADPADWNQPFEDVLSSLAELRALGVRLLVASSLPVGVVAEFLVVHGLAPLIDDVVANEESAESRIETLLSRWSLPPTEVLFVTPGADGIRAAKRVGVHAILMMNDPDEAMKLTALEPAGGVVSLGELPDVVQFVSGEDPS